MQILHQKQLQLNPYYFTTPEALHKTVHKAAHKFALSDSQASLKVPTRTLQVEAL